MVIFCVLALPLSTWSQHCDWFFNQDQIQVSLTIEETSSDSVKIYFDIMNTSNKTVVLPTYRRSVSRFAVYSTDKTMLYCGFGALCLRNYSYSKTTRVITLEGQEEYRVELPVVCKEEHESIKIRFDFAVLNKKERRKLKESQIPKKLYLKKLKRAHLVFNQ